jgi:LPXTG-motif cell wall-anchored protein
MGTRNFIIGGVIVAIGLAGGSAAASDYPPDVPPSTTVVSTTQTRGDTPVGIQRPGRLPETGSDTGSVIKIAAGAVVAGAGLVGVTRRRRHPATS